MYKLDLHTHSILSHDGAITSAQYEKLLAKNLDYVAITDHNQIDFALAMHRKLGDKIIIGEEIMTSEGEVIGLFLKDKIEPKQSLAETIKQIKDQHALVYVPHPFDSRRHGLNKLNLEKIIHQIDILEIFNARYITAPGNDVVLQFSRDHHLPGAASSDGHGFKAAARSYSIISDKPTSENLVQLLSENNSYHKKYAKFSDLFLPTINKIKKKFGWTPS